MMINRDLCLQTNVKHASLVCTQRRNHIGPHRAWSRVWGGTVYWDNAGNLTGDLSSKVVRRRD